MNIIADFSSSELKPGYYMSESFLLWALVFFRRAWIRTSHCSFIYNKVRGIIEMRDKQENGGHTSQRRLIISDTASLFWSKLHAGHINLLLSSYYNILQITEAETCFWVHAMCFQMKSEPTFFFPPWTYISAWHNELRSHVSVLKIQESCTLLSPYKH